MTNNILFRVRDAFGLLFNPLRKILLLLIVLSAKAAATSTRISRLKR